MRLKLPSDTFREQLPMAADMMKGKEEKNIIMYCTGGIRCEKASAYMLHNGFKNVFHLEGGIINYAKEVKEKNYKQNSSVKTLCLIIVWAKELQNMLLQIATNAASLAIHIQTVKTMAVICCLFNVKNVQSQIR